MARYMGEHGHDLFFADCCASRAKSCCGAGCDGGGRFVPAAIDIARAQEALFWELRASLGLARLRANQGRGGEARRLVAQVYDRFTEGFETPDLRAAKAFLDELPG